MTTKETFLSLKVGALYAELADKIDFDKVDEFVNMFIEVYVNKRGVEAIRKELMVNAASSTTTFLTRLVDVGTVQFLSENGLITGNEDEDGERATMVAHGINISMAAQLQKKKLDMMGGPVFFDIPVLYTLIARVIDHIHESLNDKSYVFNLVSIHLMGLVNSE